MEDVRASKGSAVRIKKCAVELLSIGSDIVDDKESWDLLQTELSLKSAFLFCDFTHFIASLSNPHNKTFITQLANKLFFSIQELESAVKIRSICLTRERHSEAAVILQEVITFMPYQ